MAICLAACFLAGLLFLLGALIANDSNHEQRIEGMDARLDLLAKETTELRKAAHMQRPTVGELFGKN